MMTRSSVSNDTNVGGLDDGNSHFGSTPKTVEKIHTRIAQPLVLRAKHPVGLHDTITQAKLHADLRQTAPFYQQPHHVKRTGHVPNVPPFQNNSRNRAQSSGVGKLARLPLEIRFKIYGYLIDQDFKQHYKLNDHEMRLMASSSELPALLYASSSFCEEVMQATHHGHPYEVMIQAGLVTANFCLFGFLSKGQACAPGFRNNTLRIPSHEELVIGIQTPCPRRSGDMADVRRTVQHVVMLLNSANLSLPRLRVTFEIDEDRAQRNFMHNDFALLVGPLYKLKKAAKHGMVIDRSVRWNDQVDKRRHLICNMIEKAVRGNIAEVLVIHQLLIDFQLPLNKHLTIPRYYPMGDVPETALQTKGMVTLLHQLELCIIKRGNVVPLWISEAKELMRGGHVPYSTLKGKVATWFGERWIKDAHSWASGHLTVDNPFFNDQSLL